MSLLLISGVANAVDTVCSGQNCAGTDQVVFTTNTEITIQKIIFPDASEITSATGLGGAVGSAALNVKFGNTYVAITSAQASGDLIYYQQNSTWIARWDNSTNTTRLTNLDGSTNTLQSQLGAIRSTQIVNGSIQGLDLAGGILVSSHVSLGVSLSTFNGIFAQNEGSFLQSVSSLNCVGSGVDCTAVGGILTMTINGGGVAETSSPTWSGLHTFSEVVNFSSGVIIQQQNGGIPGLMIDATSSSSATIRMGDTSGTRGGKIEFIEGQTVYSELGYDGFSPKQFFIGMPQGTGRVVTISTNGQVGVFTRIPLAMVEIATISALLPTMNNILRISSGGINVFTVSNSSIMLGVPLYDGSGNQIMAGGAGGGSLIYPATDYASFPFGASIASITVTGSGDGVLSSTNNISIVAKGSTYSFCQTSVTFSGDTIIYTTDTYVGWINQVAVSSMVISTPGTVGYGTPMFGLVEATATAVVYMIELASGAQLSDPHAFITLITTGIQVNPILGGIAIGTVAANGDDMNSIIWQTTTTFTASSNTATVSGRMFKTAPTIITGAGAQAGRSQVIYVKIWLWNNGRSSQARLLPPTLGWRRRT